MRERLSSSSPRLQSASLIRLDQIRHPYGPCPAALDAAETPITMPVERLAERLRAKLSQVYRVPTEAIMVFDTVDNAISGIVEATSGTLVGFPPSTVSSRLRRMWQEREHTLLARSVGRLGSLAPDLAADLPVDGIAIADSPSDPLGTLLKPADAVRLARACQLLIVDERYVEYAGQSLLSFAAEFDNIVVCRSFDAWAGLLDAPCGWAVMPRDLNERLGAALALPRPEAIVAALATLDWITSVDMTMRLVRDERSRLYRLLRKLSLLEPLPSWGPFLTARVAIGSREDVVAGLRERGIVVHAPEDAGLENYIRFGLSTRTSMDCLRAALLDLAPEILAEGLEARCTDADGLPLSGEELIQTEAGEVDQVF